MHFFLLYHPLRIKNPEKTLIFGQFLKKIYTNRCSDAHCVQTMRQHKKFFEYVLVGTLLVKSKIQQISPHFPKYAKT